MGTTLEVIVKPEVFSRRAHKRSAVAAAATTAAIVRARGIHKTYDTGAVKTHALRGVDLSVKRGKMVGIMGPAGCGKTPLLNCDLNADRADVRLRYITRKRLDTGRRVTQGRRPR
jgi:ABC-type lipoprotein export system ATPase subunit